jgi:hypothetical protein
MSQLSQAGRNDLDDAIDRAARQIVTHEPSPRLYAAVMADIEAGPGSGSRSDVRRKPSPSAWMTWRWTMASMSAAALVSVGVLAWQWQMQPPAAFPAPALPAPPQIARLAPPAQIATTALPPEAIATVPAKPLPAPLSPRRQAVARAYEAHREIAPVAVAGSANDAQSIHVATIPMADISVADIPISTIRVPAIDGDDPIPINTIDADGR